MKVSEFDYDLPEELIAQEPAVPRDSSRLLVVDRKSGVLEHRVFAEIVEFLRPGDVVVLNNSRVIPARLLGMKETGGKVEAVLIERVGRGLWKAIVRPGSKIKPGNELLFSGISCSVVEHCEDSGRILDFHGASDEEIKESGLLAIPPYIQTYPENPESYQTVYSRPEGSVAAPTAGLHFTESLLETLAGKGVAVEFITLHVGIGTFRPVKSELIEEHKMHGEYFTVSSEAAETINKAKADNRRIIAVGTTTVRTLESIAARHGSVVSDGGQTDIFIYPPYDFKIVDSLVTNFHLPKSTLLMLVSAFAGRELILSAYREAISRRYRFFSFGDACLLL